MPLALACSSCVMQQSSTNCHGSIGKVFRWTLGTRPICLDKSRRHRQKQRFPGSLFCLARTRFYTPRGRIFLWRGHRCYVPEPCSDCYHHLRAISASPSANRWRFVGSRHSLSNGASSRFRSANTRLKWLIVVSLLEHRQMFANEDQGLIRVAKLQFDISHLGRGMALPVLAVFNRARYELGLVLLDQIPLFSMRFRSGMPSTRKSATLTLAFSESLART